MSDSRAVRILRAAWKLIENPSRWRKRGTAARADGISAHPYAKDAVAFCALGAVARSSKADPSGLRRALDALHDTIPEGYVSVTSFQDRPETTHEDVRKWFKRAMAKLEKGEAVKPVASHRAIADEMADSAPAEAVT